MRAALDFIPRSRFRVAHSRRGVTLIEVLIAMFVMAIGLMGMLALFPMGMLQMAQAVKDERTTQTAKIMEGHAKYFWREAWGSGIGQRDELDALANNPEYLALDNPNYPPFNPFTYAQLQGYLTGPGLAARQSGSPSYPVYIDPIGFAVQSGQFQYWVAGLPLIPRRTLTIPGVTPGTNVSQRIPAYSQNIPPQNPLPTNLRIRLFSLLDDLTFDTNGVPANNPITRAGDYNAAWLIHRTKNNVRTEVNLQVVVYRRRPPADTAALEARIATNVTFASGTRQVQANLLGGVPTPKVGTWLLVAGGPATGSSDRFADFYRVVGVTVNGSVTTFEFAQEIRSHNGGANYLAEVIQMDNVAEVFDKGTLTITDRPTE